MNRIVTTGATLVAAVALLAGCSQLDTAIQGDRQDPTTVAGLQITNGPSGQGLNICRSSTAGLVNAFYCSVDDTVAWDRGELLPMLNDSFGSISVVAVLAHELGHAVQFRLGVNQSTPSIVTCLNRGTRC